MKLISLDKILYRYSKQQTPDGFEFLPEKVRSKAKKLRKQLESVRFDLTQYSLGYLDFKELFTLTCRNKALEYSTKEDPMYYCYVQSTLTPKDGCGHPLVELCRRMLSAGSDGIKSQGCWFPSYQMACTDIYESMVDALNNYLKHIIELYDRRWEYKGVPDDIGVFAQFCKASMRFEFAFEIMPKHVNTLIDFYRADGYDDASCKSYRNYLVEELAKASVASKSDKVTPSKPLAHVFPMFVYNEILAKKAAAEKLVADCKETIEQIYSKVEDIRVSRMETTNV